VPVLSNPMVAENRDVVFERRELGKVTGDGAAGVSDAEFMARLAMDDEEAFEALLTRHRRWVVNLAWQYVGDAEEAEDLAQETFVRLYRARRRYRPTGELTSYLRRTLVNLCLNERRRRRRHPAEPWEGEHDTASSADSPGDVLTRTELAARVRAALGQLPANQRMAVILRRYEDLPHREIAGAMGCSVGAVESLLHRAMRNLRQALGDYVGES